MDKGRSQRKVRRLGSGARLLTSSCIQGVGVVAVRMLLRAAGGEEWDTCS